MQSNDKHYRKNILVIDPDHEFCKNVGLYLEDSFNVFIRSSIEYLDYTIFLNQVHLILVNVDSPAHFLLKELSSLKQKHPNVKVILMYTLWPEDSSIQKKLKQLADASIAKPFDVERLKIKIENLLRQQNSINDFVPPEVKF